MANHLGMTVSEFTTIYTALAPDRRRLVLKDHPDESCILLDENGLCGVNPVKPMQCQTFPFTWMNSDSTAICPALAACCTETSDEANTPSESG